MPRDECRDCDRPVNDLPPESDGRCGRCALAFWERQSTVENPAPAPYGEPKEE